MYGFHVRVAGSFDQVEAKVGEAMSKQGIGILSDIDVQTTHKKKLNVERRPYRILGACNPPLAHRALEAEADIGLLLPCNVVVREEDDCGVTVAFMDPAAVLGLVNRAEVTQRGMDVREKLYRVRDALR